MRPILILDGERFARTLATSILADLNPTLRHIAREQDQLMTISEDILTEANTISDKASLLVTEVGETTTAIDEAIALIESLEVDPSQQAELQDALDTLRAAGTTITDTASQLDADTTRLAEVTAAPPTP